MNLSEVTAQAQLAGECSWGAAVTTPHPAPGSSGCLLYGQAPGCACCMNRSLPSFVAKGTDRALASEPPASGPGYPVQTPPP